MADDIVVRLKRELEEIRRSGYGHDWPLSQAIAVIEAQQAEIDRLRAAGDVLAEWAAVDHSVEQCEDGCEYFAALRVWQEARRG